jgi:hypothetical protein
MNLSIGFHFQGHLPKVKVVGFREAVAAGWFVEDQNQYPFVDLQLRLKSTPRVLTRWSRHRIGNVNEQIMLANEVIRQLLQWSASN